MRLELGKRSKNEKEIVVIGDCYGYQVREITGAVDKKTGEPIEKPFLYYSTWSSMHNGLVNNKLGSVENVNNIADVRWALEEIRSLDMQQDIIIDQLDRKILSKDRIIEDLKAEIKSLKSKLDK